MIALAKRKVAMKKYKKLNLIMASVSFVLISIGCFGSGFSLLSSLVIGGLLTGLLWFSIWVSQSQQAPPLDMRGQDWDGWDEWPEFDKEEKRR